MGSDLLKIVHTGTKVQFGPPNTSLALVAQNMEQTFVLTYSDKEYDVHLWINPTNAVLTINRDKLSKQVAARLIQLIPIFRTKVFDGFTLTKEKITSDLTKVVIRIKFIGNREINNASTTPTSNS